MALKIRYFKDGDQWCAVYEDFIDLQESPAGFGYTQEEAKEDLEPSTVPGAWLKDVKEGR